MRLRTTLTVAFLVLALVQVAAVMPIALRNLGGLLQRQQDARIDQQMVAVDATMARLGADVQRAMDELASSPALEDALRDAAKTPPPPALTAAAGQLMVPRGLSVLSLFDADGRTLSSGHLPARLGDADEALFAPPPAPEPPPTPEPPPLPPVPPPVPPPVHDGATATNKPRVRPSAKALRGEEVMGRSYLWAGESRSMLPRRARRRLRGCRRVPGRCAPRWRGPGRCPPPWW